MPTTTANERKWRNPDQFDVTRDAADHVTFSYGLTGCAGQGLARLEGHAMLAALARWVARSEVGAPRRRPNQVVRGLSALPTTVAAA